MRFRFYECEHDGDVDYAIEGIRAAGFGGITVDRAPTFYDSDDTEGDASALISFDVPEGMTREEVRTKLQEREECCL